MTFVFSSAFKNHHINMMMIFDDIVKKADNRVVLLSRIGWLNFSD